MICPHCDKDGVSIRSKFLLSLTTSPARCKSCGLPSSMGFLTLGLPGLASQFVFVFAFYLMLLVAALVSMFYWHWWPFVVAILVFVLFHLCLTKWAPLKAMTQDQVKSEKTLGYIFIGVVVFLIVSAAVIYE